ncbi:unnamed protein product [Notodromas monacha]|uniref:Uncharacterized protein n=1 Tax=Notodromas monacha TaxID=399045 RepID=A0A7R9BKN0_9CRUS|nr:unnamed protein product [Notodromas monacha]CAG0915897.1 unnamed protein product [Notodromas monacha]
MVICLVVTTDRGLMGSAPGTGGPGNATGLDNMASLDHCLSDIMRNDGAMQNHYRVVSGRAGPRSRATTTMLLLQLLARSERLFFLLCPHLDFFRGFLHHKTDRGLMGSAPGTGGPGNATGLDNMASLDHCLSDIMRNDGAMQNHYRVIDFGSTGRGEEEFALPEHCHQQAPPACETFVVQSSVEFMRIIFGQISANRSTALPSKDEAPFLQIFELFHSQPPKLAAVNENDGSTLEDLEATLGINTTLISRILREKLG